MYINVMTAIHSVSPNTLFLIEGGGQLGLPGMPWTYAAQLALADMTSHEVCPASLSFASSAQPSQPALKVQNQLFNPQPVTALAMGTNAECMPVQLLPAAENHVRPLRFSQSSCAQNAEPPALMHKFVSLACRMKTIKY